MWIFWPNRFQLIIHAITLFELLSSPHDQGKAILIQREALLLDAPKTYPGMVALSKPNLWQFDNFQHNEVGPRTYKWQKKGEGLQNKIKRKKLERRVHTPNKCRRGDFLDTFISNLSWVGVFFAL